MITTYSFSDVNMVISHPNVGQHVSSGEGIGSISVSMATEKTEHNVASDGSVMVSKIPGDNGTIAITIQQTSTLNKWLLKWYNYLKAASTSQWAKTGITVRAPSMQDLITATGVSPQKLADKPYQAQGQLVTWNLMAADIQQEAM